MDVDYDTSMMTLCTTYCVLFYYLNKILGISTHCGYLKVTYAAEKYSISISNRRSLQYQSNLNDDFSDAVKATVSDMI